MANPISITHEPVGKLRPNPWNSNVVGPEMEKRLDESIKQFGVYKPIVVRELEDGSLEILGGQHRWQRAAALGHESVPVVNLGAMSDRKAKAIGLADNGRYGEDDTLRLAQVLKDVGAEFDVAMFLPYTEDDLAGIFAADSIDLDSIGVDPSLDAPGGPASVDELLSTRPTITHELMRFKVPVEDQEMVKALVERTIKREGLGTESDSLVQAGMALVAIAKAAQEVM